MELIRNAHIYAPEDCGIMDVLICGEKIEAYSRNIHIDYDDLKVTDAKGMILIPGLIDQHVHIIGGGGEDGYSSLIPELNMEDCVMCGVTTVVGLLGTDGIVKNIPALVAKTKALKEQGMSAWCLTGSYAIPSVTVTGSVGKDIAMIEEVIGVKLAISDHRSSCVTKEEIARLASQVRTAGLLAKKPGFVHMHTGRGKRGLKDIMEILAETDLPVSQFRPTHMSNQLLDAVKFAKLGGMIDFTAGETTADDILSIIEEVSPERITISSDANGSMPVWDENKNLIGMGIGKMDTLFSTIKELYEKGMDFSLALSFVTKNVAHSIGQDGRKGIVRNGADADFVLLDKDMHMDTVYARGKAVVQHGTYTGKRYYQM